MECKDRSGFPMHQAGVLDGLVVMIRHLHDCAGLDI